MINRFMKFVSITDGCWIWRGAHRLSRNVRYGAFWMNGKIIRAHRASWELHNGEIPHGVFVCHKCDNTYCVNPSHLYLGTQTDNMHDAIRKGRAYIGEMGSASKLNNNEVISIRSEYTNEATQKELAIKYSVSESTIGRIVRGTNWSHIGGPILLRGRGHRTDVRRTGKEGGPTD